MTSHRTYRHRQIIATFLALLSLGIYLVLNPDSYQDSDSLNQVDVENIALQATQTTADSFLAINVLEDLAVKEKNTTEKYYRKLFYNNWGRSANGCSMREAILARDLTNIVFQDSCKVATGILADPYTGQTINFQRGQDTSSAVQIDHVVALSNAWVTGAYAMDEDTRYAMSQDPLNLIAVDGPANQAKSDQDASDWLPSNAAFQCQYVARQISVKYKYKLWVTPREKATMKNVLQKCPEETTVGLEELNQAQ